ncbi:MAG: hypothetical protein LBF85_05160 [Tannerella sp.]|jgi:hypothetical protein|nr:hypothetical protein [Tannerella sp.]
MKKNVFNKWKMICAASVAAAMAITLSSCLEGGGNSMRNQVTGVVRLDLKTLKNVLDISAYESFYSPAFSNMEDGKCCQVYYELDFELPENSAEMLASNGYYTVTVLDKTEIDRYFILSTADTSETALSDEIPLVNPVFQTGGYVRGILFLAHQFEGAEDLKTDWRLSYDWQNPYKSEEGGNIYDVYLRAVVRVSSTKTPEDRYELCAYDMNPFIESAAQREKGLGKDAVSLRFNYVSEIGEDGTVVWSKSDKLDLSVQMIIPETGTGLAVNK